MEEHGTSLSLAHSVLESCWFGEQTATAKVEIGGDVAETLVFVFHPFPNAAWRLGTRALCGKPTAEN